VSIAFPQWVVQDWVDQQQREWGPRLTALDPGLRLIPPFQNPPDPAMAENRWHIARFNEVRGQHVLIPIAGPNGEFREMDEAMFEALKRADRHSNRSSQQVERAMKLRKAAAERAKAREKEDRVDEIAARIESAERVSIRVPRNV
jgi:hypothetical protein